MYLPPPPRYRFAPPREFPYEVVAALRAGLGEEAGWVARCYVSGVEYEDAGLPPALVVGAKIKDPDPSHDRFEEVEARVREMLAGALPARAAEETDVILWPSGATGGAVDYFERTEPVVGERVNSTLIRPQMRKLFAPPRDLGDMAFENTLLRWRIGAAVLVVVLSAGAAFLAFALAPSGFPTRALIGLALFAGGSALTRVLAPPEDPAETALRTQPLTLAAVVQAHEALRSPTVRRSQKYARHEGFRMVAVFTLGERYRDDAAWLRWMADRLYALRESPATTPDETRVAQRLIDEADDHTSKIPPSIAGNDATYWVRYVCRPSDLPNDVVPSDGLLPVVLEANVRAGADEVRVAYPWPLRLWPRRSPKPAL